MSCISKCFKIFFNYSFLQVSSAKKLSYLVEVLNCSSGKRCWNANSSWVDKSFL